MDNTLSSDFHHKEHREWTSQLDFYVQEIGIFENELVRVEAEHPDLPSIVEHVEEYRSLFNAKLELISSLREKIKTHESLMADGFKEDLREMHEHSEVREGMAELEVKFGDLKQRFRRFASHND